MATNQVEAALRAYKLGQRLNPTDADNLYNMGALLLRAGGGSGGAGGASRAREAFVALRAARRLAPDDEQVHTALGYAKSRLLLAKADEGQQGRVGGQGSRKPKRKGKKGSGGERRAAEGGS